MTVELRDLVDPASGHSFDYSPFRAACARAAQALAGFRSDPAIAQVVECVPGAEGEAYAAALALLAPHRWVEVGCLRNDAVGGAPRPVTHEGVTLAAATWRYAFRAAELDLLFGPLSGLRIVEIGGGYGGLAAAVCAMASPAQYTIVDAPEPCRLQESYLDAVGVSGVETCSSLSGTPLAFDLVVSDFALSELSDDYRTVYGRALLRQARGGAFCWNGAGGLSPARGAAWLAGVTGRWIHTAADRPALAACGLGIDRLASRLYYGARA